MFNNHVMSVVNDLRALGPEINNSSSITIAAITNTEYPQLPNIYNASILSPPTDILMMWADGAALVMQNQYPQYLLTKEPDDMLVALIAALTKKNIVLYIPQDEFNIFGVILLNHIYYNYGITCNYYNYSRFSIEQSKIPFILSKFYMIDVMDPKTYLSAYPARYPLPTWVISKLANEMPSFNRPATFKEYCDYFNALNASKEQPKLKQMVTHIKDETS